MLATYRDTELSVDHPLSRTLTELDRERLLDRRTLTPLDAGAVSQLVDAHTRDQASPELHQIVYEGTEGNAFFVVEVLRHLAESGAFGDPGIAARRLAVPDSVKGVIGQRLARLGSRTVGVLIVASVLGRAFELDVLQRLSALEEDELVDGLQSAVRARVIEEVAGAAGTVHVLARIDPRDPVRRTDCDPPRTVASPRRRSARAGARRGARTAPRAARLPLRAGGLERRPR